MPWIFGLPKYPSAPAPIVTIGSRNAYPQKFGAPWPVVFGPAKVKGRLVYLNANISRSGTYYTGPNAGDWTAGSVNSSAGVYAFCQAPFSATNIWLGDKPLSASSKYSWAALQVDTSYGNPPRDASGTVAWSNGGATLLLTGTSFPASSWLTGTDVSGTVWRNLVQFRSQHLRLGAGNSQIDVSLEGVGMLAASSSAYGWGCHPADVVHFLEVSILGLASGTIDTDHGSDGTTSSSWRTWLDNYPAVRIGRAVGLSDRENAWDVLQQIAEAGNAEIVWTGGTYRFLPLDDQQVGTFVPATGTTVLWNSDELDGDELVSFEQVSEKDIINGCYATYADQAKGMEASKQYYWDENDVFNYGKKPGQNVDNPWVCNQSHASYLAQLRVRASLNRRMTFRLKVSAARWVGAERGDVVFIDDRLGILSKQVRIQSITETDDNRLEVVAVEWNQGNATPTDVTTQGWNGTFLSASGFASYDGIQDTANSASTAAQTAYDTATTASLSATAALLLAGSASGTAASASVTASTAYTMASSVSGTAASASYTASYAQSVAALAYQAAASGAITMDRLVISSMDNLFPNGMNEKFPSGSDPSVVDWQDLYNAGSGSAYSGAWVRQITTTQPGRFGASTPHLWISSQAECNQYQEGLWYEVACASGALVTGSAWIRSVVAANTGSRSFIFVRFIDANGAQVYTAQFSNSMGQSNGEAIVWTSGSAWKQYTVSAVAPANTAKTLMAYGVDATSLRLAGEKTQFDDFSFTVSTVSGGANLYPNPNCELPAPTPQYSDLTAATVPAAYRNLSTSAAFQGLAGRRLAFTASTSLQYTDLYYDFPASAGDSFSMTVMSRCSQTASGGVTSIHAYPQISFLNATGSYLQVSSPDGGDTSGTVWTPVTTYNQSAPSGTVYARARLIGSCYASVPTPVWMDFDDIVVRRMGGGDLIVDGAITAAKIAANTITGDRIQAGTVLVGKMQTNGYSEDGSGNPTAGAKIDSQGTALKVAPGNLQLGPYFLSTAGRTVGATSISCYAGSVGINPGFSLNVSSAARVDLGATATPRYVVRAYFSGQGAISGAFDSVCIGGFTHATQGHAIPFIVTPRVASYVDIGFLDLTNAYMDPTNVNTTVNLLRLAAY